jgi:ATP-dependent DNA ligase
VSNKTGRLAFDLLALDGDDLRKKPFSERKAALRKVLKRTKSGIQYVGHTEVCFADPALAAAFARSPTHKQSECNAR